MKSILAIITVVAAAAAKRGQEVMKFDDATCTEGLLYCGSTLIDQKGWDEGWLSSQARGSAPRDTLFFCETSDFVTYVQYCYNGCQDGGEGQSDACATGSFFDAEATKNKIHIMIEV